MPNDPSESRPDWQSERAKMVVTGNPPLQDCTVFDKEPPSGPPSPQQRAIPKHLTKIVGFFTGIVMDEGLVLDLCLEHCMELVKRNVESKMAGIDHFAGDSAGAGMGPYTPAHYAAVAGPLAVELYKQTLKAIEAQQDEYDKLYQEMIREREKSSPGGQRIVIP